MIGAPGLLFSKRLPQMIIGKNLIPFKDKKRKRKGDTGELRKYSENSRY